MKITKLIFAALLAVATVSCEKEPALNSNPEAAPESNMVPLILSTGGDTKTSLVGNEIHWSEGDSVAVYANLNNSPRSAKAQDINGNRANFHCKVSYLASKVCAVYPYSAALECNIAIDSKSDYVKVKVLGEQTAAPGTFADDHNISVAFATISGDLDKDGLSNTKNVAFKNVCSLLKFTLPEANKIPGNIESVMISSGSVIAGTMKINGVDSEFMVESVNGSNLITMDGTFEAGNTYCFVLASGLLDGLSVSVRMKDGNVYGMSTSEQIEMTMGKYRSLGTLDFTKMSTLSYSAEHDFLNSVLQGTNVKVNFPSTDVSNVNITITKGTVKRTITDDNLTMENGKKVAVSGSNDAAWPYLPSGDYTISGSYTMAGEVITISPATLTVAKPEGLTITGFNAYTSYTKYSAGDAAGANKLTGTSIYVEATGINVSDEILSKYANLLSLDYVSGGKAGSIVTGVLTKEITAPAYGEYSNLKYCFDGVTGATITSACHVTGLPYALNTAANDSVNPWTTSGASWNQDNDGPCIKVSLGYKGETIITKQFSCPVDIDVEVSTSGKVLGGRFADNTASITLSGEVVCSKTAKKKLGFTGATEEFSKSSAQMSLRKANPIVECKNSYSYADCATYIYSLSINYR